jgi:hypothetical protein
MSRRNSDVSSKGRTVPKAPSLRILTVEARFRVHRDSIRITGGQRGLGVGFSTFLV